MAPGVRRCSRRPSLGSRGEHRTQRGGPGTAPAGDAAGCPFCNTMMTDGVKHFEKEGEVVRQDLAELIAEEVTYDRSTQPRFASWPIFQRTPAYGRLQERPAARSGRAEVRS